MTARKPPPCLSGADRFWGCGPPISRGALRREPCGKQVVSAVTNSQPVTTSDRLKRRDSVASVAPEDLDFQTAAPLHEQYGKCADGSRMPVVNATASSI